jgi:hypothetical protein
VCMRFAVPVTVASVPGDDAGGVTFISLHYSSKLGVRLLHVCMYVSACIYVSS